MFINIGFGNFISDKKIVSILNADSSPIKRMIRVAKENSSLIDATCGRKTRSVIVTDSDHIILSALESDAVNSRLCNNSGTN